jgi:hypothetical protein
MGLPIGARGLFNSTLGVMGRDSGGAFSPQANVPRKHQPAAALREILQSLERFRYMPILLLVETASLVDAA